MLALAFGLSQAILACTADLRPASPQTGTTRLTGTVLETFDGLPYSYLRLKTDQGEVWAAVPVAKIDKDKRVTVLNAVTLKNVDAPAIGRRFEIVYFGALGPEGTGAAGGN